MKGYGCDSDQLEVWSAEFLSIFSIPSQICWNNLFNALIKSFILSNLALSYDPTSHWIFILKKSNPTALTFFLSRCPSFASRRLCLLTQRTQVLTMGMFFGSGPTPSPTSIPLGLPSLEDVFSGDFRVGRPYKKIHFLYQLVSKSQRFI